VNRPHTPPTNRSPILSLLTSITNSRTPRTERPVSGRGSATVMASSRQPIRDAARRPGRPVLGIGQAHPARLPAAAAAAFSNSSSASSWAEPRCSMSRELRREERTICTAIAPKAVFTVRTYGTAPLYRPRLVRNSGSQPRDHAGQRTVRPSRPLSVSRVRCHSRVLESRSTAQSDGRSRLMTARRE